MIFYENAYSQWQSAIKELPNPRSAPEPIQTPNAHQGHSRLAESGRLPGFALFHPGAWSSALAIRQHSKPHRLVVPHMPVGLLSCRSPGTTRKKSAPGPTAPFAPTQAHRRRSDEPCGTSPPDAERRLLPASSADPQTK